MGGMNLPVPTPEQIQQFRALYQSDFGVELTQEEARDKLIGLIHIAYVIYSPLKYFLYARKSEEDNKRQVQSIESQIKELRQRFPDLNIVQVFEEARTAKEPGRPISICWWNVFAKGSPRDFGVEHQPPPA